MKIRAIKCPSCLDTVYSRARHDYRSCSCKEVAIDGGFEYIKINFAKTMPEQVELDIEASKKELYDDWNLGKNKLGLIKKKNHA